MYLHNEILLNNKNDLSTDTCDNLEESHCYGPIHMLMPLTPNFDTIWRQDFQG